MLSESQKAQDEFQIAIKNLGMSSLNIKDDDGKHVSGINLMAMALPDMWLPKLMMRADNIGRLIVGERIFSAAYMKDNKTLTGIRVCDVEEDIAKAHGYIEKVNEDAELRRLVIKQVVATSILNKDGFAYLKEFESYDISEPNDELIRPMDRNLVVAAMLRDFTEKAYPVLENVINYNSTMEPSL